MSGRFFASDNAAAIHPRMLEAIADANRGHALGYGHDDWSRRLEELLRRELGSSAAVMVVFGGTGANVVALRSAVDSHQAVICSDAAHIHTDSCGAPERIVGCKLLPVPSVEGRIDPDAVASQLWGRGRIHHSQPRVVSVGQATELGTVYRPQAMKDLADFAHEQGMLLHVDGARLVNAAAALGTTLGKLISGCDVDLLSLGGTKCGLLGGEVVVLRAPELAERAPFYRKQCAQLPSKMRYVSAQLIALLEDGLWKRLAAHANSMAARLAQGVAEVAPPEYPVETNVVFARLPRAAVEPLQKRFYFHRWPRDTGPPERPLVRWMTSWDSRPEEVDAFAEAIREEVGQRGR